MPNIHTLSKEFFFIKSDLIADLPNKGSDIERKPSSHDNSVALAAVRDLQTQRNLRLGAPPATKSTLLIRSVQKVIIHAYT